MASSQKTDNLSICGIILCAGSGQRSGLLYNKILHYVGKKTILEMTLDRFLASRVEHIMLVVSPEDYDAIFNIASSYDNVHICLGGDTRGESVKNGLAAIGHCDIIVIHDGARPYVQAKIIDESIDSTIKYGSGIVAVPTIDTIKEIKNNTILRGLSRSGLYNIQTPQTFWFEQIASAYHMVNQECSDDSEVFCLAGYEPRIVVGDYDNVKVTNPSDFLRPIPLRSKVGVGFDVHQLVSNRPLILGGITIPHSKGLLAHSDGDVLCHAIMDSLLSAAGLPDIGNLFPDTDAKYKNASSIRLLANVNELIARRGFAIGNISSVLMAQQPKISPYTDNLVKNIALTLKINPMLISVSATTTEGLGIIGNQKGIACSSSCLLYY